MNKWMNMNNTKVRELQGSSCWKRGSVAHDDSWCPGGRFLVHHQWAKWKQNLPSNLNCDSWKWPRRDSSGLLNKFCDTCFKGLSPVTADVVEISKQRSICHRKRDWNDELFSDDLAQKRSLNLLKLPSFHDKCTDVNLNASCLSNPAEQISF